MLFALVFSAVTAQTAGSCYGAGGGHAVVCNVEKDDCEGTFFERGYVSDRTNCCLCKEGCEEPSTDCNYYDVHLGSCYGAGGGHAVVCNIAKDDCEGTFFERGYVSDRTGCCLCKEGCKHTSADCNYYDVVEQISRGSCYDMSDHSVDCNVEKADCLEPFYWYEPGYVSGYSKCCHCLASCAKEDQSDDCNYHDVSDEADDTDDADAVGSCYDLQDTHTVECGVKKSACNAMKGVWYKSGHISHRGGKDCCHCKDGCPAEGLSEGCKHYDDVVHYAPTPPPTPTPTPKPAANGAGPSLLPAPDSGAFAVLGLAWLSF